MSVEINITDQIVEIDVAAGAVIQPVWGGITGTLSNQTDLQNALNLKVPYTGATANVDLGEFELKAGQIEYDQTPTGTAGTAVTRWNDSLGTIETTLKGGNVVLRHGRDMFERVVNKTGVQLTKAAYQAVRVSDAQGQRLAVELAQANNDNNSADTIGLVVETIDNNQEGMIYTVGEIENINTTGSLQGETWGDGNVLYLSPTTAGRITNVKPTAPQHLVIIGYVVYAHAVNGKLYVKVMNGWELGELHDVDTTGATNGQVLKYNGTIWTPSGDVGITSLNGLNATSQTFATGSSGTDFNISSATSTHTFNLPTASGTNRGLLSSADWTTFNNKQNALTNPITGTAAAGQVAYFTGSTTQAGSNNLFYSSNILTITHPTGGLPFILNNGATTGTIESLRVRDNTASQQTYSLLIGTGQIIHRATWLGGTGVNMNHVWANATSAGAVNNNMTLYSTGNLGIATSSDSGQRLQVVGTSYFSDSVGIGSNDLAGYGLRISKNITGASISVGVLQNGLVQSDSLTGAYGFRNILGTQAASFTLGFYAHYYSRSIALGAGSAVTNQYGFYAESSLTTATNNYGFYGELAAATGRWNLYMNGTANNYMAGSLGIGTTTPSRKQEIYTATSGSTVSLLKLKNQGAGDSGAAIDFDFFATDGVGARIAGIRTGAASFQSALAFYTNQGSTNVSIVEAARFTYLQNFLIGSTTDSGEKLQVTGTAKITGDATFGGSLTVSDGTSTLRIVNASGLGLIGTLGSHPLVFRTNNTERMRLDASGNLGLGVTPSAWSSVVPAFQIGSGGSFLAARSASPEIYLGTNARFNGTNWLYQTTNTATYYAQDAGRHIWYQAASGTAGNTITFTQAMTLTAAGRLILGAGDSGELLQVNGTAKITGASSFGGNMTLSLNQNTGTIFTISNTGTGISSYSQLYLAANASSGSGRVGKNSNTINPYKIIAAADFTLYNETAGDIAILNDFASGNIKFAAGGSSTAQMTLTSAGNLCIGVTSGNDFLNIGAGTTAKAQINLASSTAPTSPNNGDIWFDGTDLKMRIGGVTKTFTLI